MRYSGIGGQAVMEGIMMRHQDQYSIAVRKPDKEIEVKIEDYKSFIKHKKILPQILTIYDSIILTTAERNNIFKFYHAE